MTKVTDQFYKETIEFLIDENKNHPGNLLSKADYNSLSPEDKITVLELRILNWQEYALKLQDIIMALHNHTLIATLTYITDMLHVKRLAYRIQSRLIKAATTDVTSEIKFSPLYINQEPASQEAEPNGEAGSESTQPEQEQL